MIIHKLNSYSYIWSSTKHEDFTNQYAFCIDSYSFYFYLKGNIFRCRSFYKL